MMFPVYVKGRFDVPPEDPIYYLVTGSGLFLVKNNPFFVSRTKVASVAGLPDEEEGFAFRGPLLTAEVLGQTLAFFEGLYEKYASEGVAIIFFRPSEKAYRVVVPRQRVGAVHCVYEEPEREAHEDVRVGTIHSHGAEDPYHSERDDADEVYQDGLHLIFGRLDADAMLLCSAVADGQRFPLETEEVVEETPGRADVEKWHDWAVEEIEKKVTPLERPIHFGT